MSEPIIGGQGVVPAGENREPGTAASANSSETTPVQPEAVTAEVSATEVAPPQPEIITLPEGERTPGETAESRVAPSTVPAPVAAVMVPTNAALAGADPNLAKVERLLEDNIWDVYVSLPEKARLAFKKKGEQTAAAISALVARTHVRASKIHDLVRAWLGKIPGVNEFFLLQESKIKTDSFVQLAAWVARKAGIG